ncbi:holo-[acyl-carrier-protein] synthase [Kluyveromyces lactis]|uniref:Mitochondrial holo-[acyl-carrier-protein] synthase n=1 Tax=Kluyveromyces lactis (strain ATCC 8585 / CBS 2359 / DSM 70799 / NBRC 1267 / NRRL Y-1140 / WM37) TaxID=284590 RepID=Q6CKD9_KLULA|nr:uncharacterized protein KLLA0_F11418g [Kluyveromyces lactis]CAG98308.1 KLLA0F11418p [Kluyveromyces lactis]|eukprot:XP_455600.1 uncharacterized protein KLLA0_F11418g [Kluyveromyces lactis]
MILPHIFLKNTNVISAATDIVFLPRVEKLLQRNSSSRLHRILKKFMHPYEIKQFETLVNSGSSLKHKSIYIAGVWASKESLFKTLPHSSDRPSAIDIYTKLAFKSNDPDGKPNLNLDQKRFSTGEHNITYWNEYLHSTRYEISISHDQDYLICILLHLRDANLNKWSV